MDQRSRAATTVGWLAVLGALGSTVMTLAHVGLSIPGFAAFGPGRLIVPAAVGFGVGTVLFALAAFGVFRRRRWAWVTALAVNVLAFVVATTPLRGWVSAFAAAVTVIAVVVLLSPPGRAGLRHR